MEIILGILFLVFLNFIINAFFKTVGAAGNAVIGKGSFSENMELSFKGMGEFDVKLQDTHLQDDGTGPIVKEIVGKGLLPVLQNKNVGIVISVFDKTSGELEPVISALDIFQEADSAVYQHITEMGQIQPDQGFVNWARLGVVIPDILEPPYSGTRNILVIVRMIDLDNPPAIEHGYHQTDDAGIVWQKSLTFDYNFIDKGYREASEHRDEAVAITLKIGMAVAMADGNLDDSEGEVLKNWIIKSIAPFSDEKQISLKTLYNNAMRDSYSDAEHGLLSLSDLTERLNEIGEKTTKYETIELCFEVMAADGVADENELKTINKIAEALNLDIDEINKMRDQKIVGLDTSATDHANIEVILGISPEWSNEQIKKHLRTEFQKWNNRLNTLSDGVERENAQLMLNKISDARKKYV
tara:strand:- start:5756 stop:6991 length:1236 start_codon:yes stop_codon:yes gene_type:complete